MAGFNINRFRANGLRYGGARPTQFTVTLTFPPLAEIPVSAAQTVQFTCHAASLPESTIGTVPVSYFGRRINLAGDRQYPEWDVSILNDEDFNVRHAFEAWHNAINTIESNRLDPRVSNITPDSINSYKTRATVTQFAKSGPGEIDGEGAIRTYTFEGIFPSTIGGIQLRWDMENQIEEFPVRFAYDWWVPSSNGSDTPSFNTELSPP